METKVLLRLYWTNYEIVVFSPNATIEISKFDCQQIPC